MKNVSGRFISNLNAYFGVLISLVLVIFADIKVIIIGIVGIVINIIVSIENIIGSLTGRYRLQDICLEV